LNSLRLLLYTELGGIIEFMKILHTIKDLSETTSSLVREVVDIGLKGSNSLEDLLVLKEELKELVGDKPSFDLL